MARAKIKVEHRLVAVLGQFRQIHAEQSNDEQREAMRLLILKQLDLMEWVQTSFPDGRRSRAGDRKAVGDV